ncbi:ATP-binding protein [Kitasatospora purpeofusca]|uniref:ATP-binding protein n=1 Tax=Kitasatospora purpeofusca TaxID=67352 RepID=UPI0035DC5739
MTALAGLHRFTLAATAADPAERTAWGAPARAALRTIATAWGITGEVLDDLVAVASELLANAALHSGSANLPVRLLLDPAEGRFRIEVDDQARVLPPPRPTTRRGDGQAVTGRGLLMVEMLADRWGATATGSGKTVWAELALPVLTVRNADPSGPGAAQ